MTIIVCIILNSNNRISVVCKAIARTEVIALVLSVTRNKRDNMSRIKRCGNKTISELIDEEEKIVRELKNAEQNLHIIRNKKKQLTGKQQTRRLCNHGRLIEYFLPPDKYTDGQMLLMLILEELFEDPSGYSGARKPPVRRTGNRESGQ